MLRLKSNKFLKKSIETLTFSQINNCKLHTHLPKKFCQHTTMYRLLTFLITNKKSTFSCYLLVPRSLLQFHDSNIKSIRLRKTKSKLWVNELLYNRVLLRWQWFKDKAWILGVKLTKIYDNISKFCSRNAMSCGYNESSWDEGSTALKFY